MKINLDIIERNSTTGEATKTGEKLVYSAKDFGTPCSRWVRETSYKRDAVEGVVQTSGLSFSTAGYGKRYRDTILYYANNSNDVQQNAMGIGLFSTAFSGASGIPLYPDNFLRGTTLFTARKSIIGNWINQKDEYVAPTVETSNEYKEFVADSLVYALFHGANNCTSCRDIPYKESTVDISNPMFWKTPDEMRSLADENHYTEMYNDLRGNPPVPYVAKIIDEQLDLVTPIAQEVFKQANELLVDSMKTRQAFSLLHPEYHLDSWDCGNYQLKYLWREQHKEQYDEFREAFKKLESSIISRVYSLGFLRT